MTKENVRPFSEMWISTSDHLCAGRSIIVRVRFGIKGTSSINRCNERTYPTKVGKKTRRGRWVGIVDVPLPVPLPSAQKEDAGKVVCRARRCGR